MYSRWGADRRELVTAYSMPSKKDVKESLRQALFGLANQRQLSRLDDIASLQNGPIDARRGDRPMESRFRMDT